MELQKQLWSLGRKAEHKKIEDGPAKIHKRMKSQEQVGYTKVHNCSRVFYWEFHTCLSACYVREWHIRSSVTSLICHWTCNTGNSGYTCEELHTEFTIKQATSQKFYTFYSILSSIVYILVYTASVTPLNDCAGPASVYRRGIWGSERRKSDDETPSEDQWEPSPDQSSLRSSRQRSPWANWPPALPLFLSSWAACRPRATTPLEALWDPTSSTATTTTGLAMPNTCIGGVAPSPGCCYTPPNPLH